MKADQAQTAYFNEANAANETRERETRGGRRKTFFVPSVYILFISNLPDHLHAHAPRRRRHALRHAPQGHVRGKVRGFHFRDLDHRRRRDAADELEACPGFCAPLATPAAALSRWEAGGVFMV